MTKEQLIQEPTRMSVVAAVSMNDGEGLVLNRPVRFVYERVGRDYIGADGPFKHTLVYQAGSGRFVAFAGRPLTLDMSDGSTVTVQNSWWNSMQPGHVGIAYSDVESLRRCYVFSGGATISPEDLAQLRATYSGRVYPYWDYEAALRARPA